MLVMYKILTLLFSFVLFAPFLFSQTNVSEVIKNLDKKLKRAIDNEEHSEILKYTKELKQYLKEDYSGEILFYEGVALYNTRQLQDSKKVMREYIHSTSPFSENFPIAVELYKSIEVKDVKVAKGLGNKVHNKNIKVKNSETVKDVGNEEHKFYVQVYAFFKESDRPRQQFLNKITSHGYSYIFHQPTSKKNNLTKVLIGPFKDIKSAKKNLKDVRIKIVRKAFIFKIK